MAWHFHFPNTILRSNNVSDSQRCKLRLSPELVENTRQCQKELSGIDLWSNKNSFINLTIRFSQRQNWLWNSFPWCLPTLACSKYFVFLLSDHSSNFHGTYYFIIANSWRWIILSTERIDLIKMLIWLKIFPLCSAWRQFPLVWNAEAVMAYFPKDENFT